MEEEKGVTVGYKEIFDQIQGVSNSLIKMDGRMQRMEEHFAKLPGIDERSRKAEDDANDALKEATEAKQQLENYIQAQQERERADKKYKTGILAIAVPVILFLMPILVSYYVP